MKDEDKGLFDAGMLDIWESQYARFAAFKAQGLAPNAEVEKELNQWAAIQRRMQHLLPAALKNKLAAIGFDFEEPEPDWHGYLAQLERFSQVHGHTFVPAEDPAYAPLRDWLIRQINGQQYLPEEQYQQLQALGVDWQMTSNRGLRWQQMFLRLKAFYQEYGHSRVPQKWARDPQLANWVLVQRRVYARHKMPQERVRLLQNMDFVWHIQPQYDQQWAGYLGQLAAFRQQHGHCQVPGSHKQLASWIERQRTAKTKNLLPPDRERQLNEINFIWAFTDIRENHWQQKYGELQAYKKQHGHCLVPVNYKENKSLGQWVAAQRRLEARQKLAKGKQQLLDQLGFVWSRELPAQLKGHYDQQWQANLEKLRTYRQLYGTCQVSLKIDPELQRWTRWQRMLFYEGKLLPERRDQLDAIHFPWCIKEGYWWKMYQELAAFKRRHGHTRVPHPQGPNNRLASWVYRLKKNRAQLTAQQVDLLNEIGFDWHVPARTVVPWREMYGRLVAFKQAFGHTRVPVTWAPDPKLGKWVSRMRQEQDHLLPERKALLEAVDFDWGRQLIQTA